MDRFFQDEPLLWKSLKATQYYAALTACTSGSAALPFKHWVRFMLHVPSTLTIDELVRIFDEEDTVTVMATVSPSQPDEAIASPVLCTGDACIIRVPRRCMHNSCALVLVDTLVVSYADDQASGARHP